MSETELFCSTDFNSGLFREKQSLFAEISLLEPHDLISLSCLWQAIIYFCIPPCSFWSLLRQIHVLLNMCLTSTGIWPDKHNLGRLCQSPLTFTTHFTCTLHEHCRRLQRRQHRCKQLTFLHTKYHRPSLSLVSIINFYSWWVLQLYPLTCSITFIHGHHGHQISVTHNETLRYFKS